MRQDLLQGPHHESEDAVDEEERDQEADGHRDYCDDQAPSQLIEVLEKRHLAAGILRGLLDVVVIRLVVGCRLGGAFEGH